MNRSPYALSSLALVLASVLAPFSTTASGATVMKVNKAKDSAILKLGDGEGSGLKAGDTVHFEAGGETIEAEVLAVSGRSLRLKVLFGIDSLKDNQKATLSSGGGSSKSEAKERPASKRDGGSSRDDPSQFVLGAGGRSHPFSGDLRAPWVMGSPLLYSSNGVHGFLNPAQLTRVPTYALAAGVEVLDAKIEDKSDDVKFTADVDGQIFGFTGVVNIQSGVHIGLTYGKADFKTKFKTDYDTETPVQQDVDGKGKSTDDEMTFLFGMPVNDRVSVGLQYAQESNKNKSDGSDDDSTSYQILRPGVTYQTQQYELGLVYSPPIEIHETDGTAERPRAWLLHAQYRLAGGTSAGGQVTHYHLAGIDEDGTNHIAAKLGAEIGKADWGTFGAFGIFEQKRYMKKNLASGATIPQVGFQILFGLPVNKHTDVNTGLTYGRGTAKAKQGGESTKLDSQLVSLYVSASYQP